VRRFEFRLERVLKLKKQREWLAEMRQKEARAALDAALAAVAAVNDQIARNAAALAAALAQAGQDGSWLARQQQSVGLGHLLELAEAEAREREVKFREACAARTQVAQEVEALLHLRGEEWQAHRAEVQKAQQEQLDEVGMRLWRSGPDGSGAWS
jgi:flagellar FliJ protein